MIGLVDHSIPKLPTTAPTQSGSKSIDANLAVAPPPSCSASNPKPQLQNPESQARIAPILPSPHQIPELSSSVHRVSLSPASSATASVDQSCLVGSVPVSDHGDSASPGTYPALLAPEASTALPQPAPLPSPRTNSRSVYSFFDPDVVFPPPLPAVVGGQCDCAPIKETSRQEMARRRLCGMVDKELTNPPGFVAQCGLPDHARLEAIQWILEFDLLIQEIPPFVAHTRHRAISLFSAFWSTHGLSPRMSKERAIQAVRLSAVTSLMLASKVDVDILRPLFSITLDIWVFRVSDWVKIEDLDLAGFEMIILKALDYCTTEPTPFDILAELVIASPELEILKDSWSHEWEEVEAAFSLILERAVQDHTFVQFRTSVLAAAALFLALDRCLFHHPGEIDGPNLWTRDVEGAWTEMVYAGELAWASESPCRSVPLEGVGAIMETLFKLAVCTIMGLDKVNRAILLVIKLSSAPRGNQACELGFVTNNTPSLGALVNFHRALPPPFLFSETTRRLSLGDIFLTQHTSSLILSGLSC